MYNKFFLALTISIIAFITACAPVRNDIYQGKSADAIYAQGKQFLEEKLYRKAAQAFEALEARYPYGEYTDKAKLGLIYSYYKRDELEATLAAADDFIAINPRHKNIDYVYYIKGLANYNAYYSFAFKHFPLDRSKRDPTYAEQAFKEFKILLEHYPNSPYAQDAHQRMLFLRDQIAQHELYIANYYFKRGAYLAAINRTNAIMQKFHNTNCMPEVLALLAKSYRALGITQLEHETIELLNKNYPGKSELTGS